jgi:hypothetical protein
MRLKMSNFFNFSVIAEQRPTGITAAQATFLAKHFLRIRASLPPLEQMAHRRSLLSTGAACDSNLGTTQI